MTSNNEHDKNHPPVWFEVIKLAPQFAWLAIGILLLSSFSGPVLKMLEHSNITKFGIGVLSIEVAQSQIKKAATEQNQNIPQTLNSRIERLPRTLFDSSILWLDDNPQNNVSERRALSSLGLTVDTARTTNEALKMLSTSSYELIISDFSRIETNDSVCNKFAYPDDLPSCFINHLNSIAEEKNKGRTSERTQPPVIFYGRIFRPEEGSPPYSFGSTSRVDELFHLILDALERRSSVN